MNSNFHKIVTLSQDQKDKMLLQELCLRFFALHNFINEYRERSIQDFFDKAMEKQCENPSIELIDKTFSVFQRICIYLNSTSENVFKLAALSFSTSMFDSIMLALAPTPNFEEIQIDIFLERLEKLKNNQIFRESSGSASSSPGNIKNKVKIAIQTLMGDTDGSKAD